MQDSDHTFLRLRLRPHFSRTGATSHLSLTYTIQQPDSAPFNDPLLLFDTFYGNVPSPPYSEADVRASDALGALPLIFVPTGKQYEQEWRLGRDVIGDLTLRMDVYPRNVDQKTLRGAIIDLRADRGGLMGSGRWFLPRLNLPGTFTNIVEWDLSQAPPHMNIRAVCSFGEGPGPISVTGPSTTLTNTVFMIGPVRSDPAETLPGASAGFRGCYWFGDLPPSLDRLKDFNAALFGEMVRMFGTENGSYRLFVRTTEGAFGGRAFAGSYIVEYDPTVVNEMDDDDIKELFAHEMAHEFNMLEEEEDDDDAW